MASSHYARREREHDTLRPVIVDERPSRHVHFDAAPAAYQPSSSRRHHVVEPTYVAPSSDDERRRRRSRRETRYHDNEEYQRQADRERAAELERIMAARESRRQPQQEADPELDRNIRKAERIARLNERIDARPAVPIPTLRRTATDFAGEERERELREAVRGLDLGDRPLRRSQTNTALPRREAAEGAAGHRGGRGGATQAPGREDDAAPTSHRWVPAAGGTESCTMMACTVGSKNGVASGCIFFRATYHRHFLCQALHLGQDDSTGGRVIGNARFWR
ncbi:conserved hypothetical protein [Verticillium alfalfae VaMs.102]|uniref:Uncharacterized protein n=1 Tax=Verticillium alfalfae (strain VaMs.102 / ATCC MYA-4576 / FGSC 10136) TaxID=526221 RepID=C9SEQ0_VERA1|nr:conserved hypothetical protein [Verticillium alfalfae VaMs.102]EEY16643.1 conserved hypothetical protein [Verticillium alfalfae VaMs.102]